MVSSDGQSERDLLPFSTKLDIPASTRSEVVSLLGQRLAACIDLQSHCKHAHWNVKGHKFLSLHELFDRIHASVLDYGDLIAERIVQLGGVADGTVKQVAQRSELIDYPGALSAGHQHVAALSDSLSQFGRTARIGIEEMNALEDAVSADVLTEVARGVDRWLWFVEAHEQHEGGHAAR
ncbi:DNA starvation/stationary phase protection protein Dps [Gemmatimonas groenlandica]|uniref:DNA starvation/stationary phase protection protein Dps n=2 Tax=Gemmatimonas groenlandica TaxID=2732249 RepID=A0A6M4IV53_9BACT|nr:DNA starvation/stationary phase protection protein Dps [Gemmatimonas groenlandica]